MKRLRAAVTLELRLQSRYRFFHVAAFITLVWVAALQLVPAWATDYAVPFVIFVDLATVGFFLIGALVLYERDGDTLTALLVTPLRFREYLAAKLVTLTLLAIGLSALVAVAGAGLAFDPALLLLGVVLSSLVSCLVGLITVAPFPSFSSYVIPSALPLWLLGLPIFTLGDWWSGPLFYLVPTYGAFVLLRGAFAPVTVGEAWLAVAQGVVWVGVLALAARWAFDRYLARRGG